MAKKSGIGEKAKVGNVKKKDQRTSGIWKMAREGGEEKLNITIRVNKKLAKDFRALCKANKVSVSKAVVAFFTKELGI